MEGDTKNFYDLYTCGEKKFMYALIDIDCLFSDIYITT